MEVLEPLLETDELFLSDECDVCDADIVTFCVEGVVFNKGEYGFGVDRWICSCISCSCGNIVGESGASCKEGASCSCSIDGV